MLRANPEIELLLCCARTKAEPAISQRVRQIVESGINWDSLIERASEHGLTTLLFRHLGDTCPDIVPKHRLAELQKSFERVRSRNRLKAAETVRVLEALRLAGINGIPFKGPALAVSAYGDLSLRQFGDVDILIKQDEMGRAYQVLFAQGYKLRRKLGHDEEIPADEARYHVFFKEEGWLVVDLQSIIASSNFIFRIDHPEVWNRLHTVSLEGGAVQTLAPEDTLLILCVHGSKHLWEKILWICDVAEVVRTHDNMDLEYLKRRCQSLGCHRMLELGLLLARDLLGSAKARDILRELKVRTRVGPLARDVSRRLLEKRIDPTADIEKSLFYLQMTDGYWNRMKYRVFLCYSLHIPEHRKIAGTGLVLLFYLVLPFRWIIRQTVRSDRLKQSIVTWLERFG